MAEKLQVFGFWASPFSSRVELALKLKALEYQYIEEDLTNKSELLLKYNPIYNKVPVLVHHGKPIAESLVILEYIEDNWKSNPIFPQHPHERAVARFWAKYIDDKVVSAVLKAVFSRGEEKEKAVEDVWETLEPLENELNGKRLFGGDRIGFVDVVGSFVGYWVPTIEESFGIVLLRNDKFPKLTKWIQELLNHSLVKEVLPSKLQLIAYMQAVHPAN